MKSQGRRGINELNHRACPRRQGGNINPAVTKLLKRDDTAIRTVTEHDVRDVKGDTRASGREPPRGRPARDVEVYTRRVSKSVRISQRHATGERDWLNGQLSFQLYTSQNHIDGTLLRCYSKLDIPYYLRTNIHYFRSQ
ncbi:hypothetical protein EVAR_45853_1 [Eumeta japonica]|uniref:Uncharacterized protein n=1 Tax=Eumeta variegata TaxID=151549 RepID=A0A4C1WPJ8_EUMVA|nr:hypothetical protein EVAR_45853_1 [Eumeta japonica]